MDVTHLGSKTVLVTGAASGIGKECALAFAQRGARLVICDLNAQGLDETERQLRSLGGDVLARPIDVSSRDAMRDFAAEVHQQVPAVDILVNNAGVGLGAAFLDTGLDDWDWIIGTNLLGVVYGCHYFVPAMVARGLGGHVVNVASAAAFAATAGLCAYSATKFGVLGLSEALRDELSAHRIGVTAVCPGLINTPITTSSRLLGPYATENARRLIVDMYERRNYSPERVARNILKAVQRNRAVAPVAAEAWFMYYLKRLAPGIVFQLNRAMAARMQHQFRVRQS